MAARGVVAAGHPVSAQLGADALRDGGNAVDAALAAVLGSFTAEPLLTGLGAGGYLLVVPVDAEPVLLDFFVEASGRGADPGSRGTLVPVEVSFGDAVQPFHIGAASVGTYGVPAGIAAASVEYGRLPLADLTAPAAELARAGVPLTRQQAYVVEILAPIVTATPECAALFAPGGSLLGHGDLFRNPEMGDTLDLLGREGAGPFYKGAVATLICDWLAARGGATLTAEDLSAYDVVEREPIRVAYRDAEVLLNPPPSAGGALLALALARLNATAGAPDAVALVESMDAAQLARTPDFIEGLADPGFLKRFLALNLGSTTHTSAIDADGNAASVTCSNGEGSGIVVPGTGIHLNNMQGEEDLNPLGFHRHAAGRRLPSMMCPTAVLRNGVPELVLGSAGSNRIRSALLQTIANVVDRGMAVQEAVDAPRLHSESGTVYAEPGTDVDALEAAGYVVQRFRDRNLFFGGVQAARRRPQDGALGGGGDPRRGGAVVVA